MKHITDTGGMPEALMAFADGLLPILGDPDEFLTDRGSLDADAVQRAKARGGHTVTFAGGLILGVGWFGNSPLAELAVRASSGNRTHLARALRAMADELDPRHAQDVRIVRGEAEHRAEDLLARARDVQTPPQDADDLRGDAETILASCARIDEWDVSRVEVPR